jgi:UDP:flavonoid glycosyltransferase YjiC (YdhE family)
MSRIAFVTWNGGGNLAPALAIGRELRQRGVPLMCVPGVGADQPIIAARVEALGAGQTVSCRAPAYGLHDAAGHVLATQSYQQIAGRLARIIGQHDGAVTAASALQDLAARPPKAHIRRSGSPGSAGHL